MPKHEIQIAIVFAADANAREATELASSRLAGIAEAFAAAGAVVRGVPYADALADTARRRLRDVDGVLVWYNPFEGGRDRSILNALLRDVAAHGVQVSAHPDAIDRIGTKEVLFRTRQMGWGCDTRLHRSRAEIEASLCESLLAGPRVLKQMRGQSGEGVWKADLAARAARPAPVSLASELLVQHAKRGANAQMMPMGDFLARCETYLAAGGGMIEQPYQERIVDGMVRCYVVEDKVAGFGEQRVNALYPAPAGAEPSAAPQPGPRLYFPPTRPDLQRLKAKLEQDWIGELCLATGLSRAMLPVLWDVDFLYGPKDAQGHDSYVLCEINVSSVYPFPPSAMAPLVARTMARLRCGEG
ncbi:MAG: Cj0069 family protein [Hyphomicrobiaceae bacterium]|nr:Cj0069 family protein [Hyphomicrobiaceae bacterium]